VIFPAVAYIESAIDMLKMHTAEDLNHQLREFRELGDNKLAQLRVNSVGHNDLEVGYLLGIETARALLFTNPVAIQNKVEI
jgi:hypothetical protein